MKIIPKFGQKEADKINQNKAKYYSEKPDSALLNPNITFATKSSESLQNLRNVPGLWLGNGDDHTLMFRSEHNLTP